MSIFSSFLVVLRTEIWKKVVFATYLSVKGDVLLCKILKFFSFTDFLEHTYQRINVLLLPWLGISWFTVRL